MADGEAASTARILELLESVGDTHYVVVYSDLGSLQKIYCQYAKRQLEKNEVVVLLPYYETTERVRAVLERKGVDVKMHESRGFLAIMDSYRVYLGFQQGGELLFARLVSHAAASKKSGISIMADMGAFYFIEKLADLAGNTGSKIPVRGFCAYHQKDFEKLSEGQRKAVFGGSYRPLFVQKTS